MCTYTEYLFESDLMEATYSTFLPLEEGKSEIFFFPNDTDCPIRNQNASKTAKQVGCDSQRLSMP